MTYVLYVAKSKATPSRFCAGSSLCMSLAEYLPSDYVDVRNCDELRATHGTSIPTWLIGTPTLVSPSGSDIFRGTQAVQKLQQVAIAYAEKKGSSQAATNSAQGSRAPPPSASNPPSSLRRGEAIPTSNHAPRPNARGEEDHHEDAELSDLWSSRVPDQEDASDLDVSRKITGDDLAKAVSARHAPPPPTGPPPPPPPSEHD